MSASRYQQWLLDKEAWEELRRAKYFADRAEMDRGLLPYIILFTTSTAVLAAATYAFNKYRYDYAASLTLVGTFISGSALALLLFMLGAFEF